MGVLRARVGGVWQDIATGGSGGYASGVSVDPSGLSIVTGTNVQSALAQLDNIAANIEDQTATANGDFVSTTIRSQLDELDARIGVSIAQSPDILNTTAWFVDDFLGGESTSGNIGQLGWKSQVSGGTVTLASAAGAMPVLGVMYLDSGLNVGNYATIYLPAGTQYIVPAFIWQARCLLFQPVAGNQCVSRFGLGNAIDGSESPNGMYFEASTNTGSTIHAISSSSASGGVAGHTDTNTGLIPGGDGYVFQKFTIASSGSGQVDFFVDDVLAASHVTDNPGLLEVWQPFFSIIKTTLTTTSKTMYVDYVYMKTITER